DVLANLAPFPTDSAGLMVGRGRPWQQSHRHYSHLLAIYPLRLITPDRPDERALIETSLATWERDISLFRGYSFTGGAAMHALLGHGDVAVTRLNSISMRHATWSRTPSTRRRVLSSRRRSRPPRRFRSCSYRIGAVRCASSLRSRARGQTPPSTGCGRTGRFSSARCGAAAGPRGFAS